MSNLRITDIPQSERPRERLAKLGAQVLSTSELLAIIIRTGTRDLTALDLAHQLLNECGGNLKKVFKLDVMELSKLRGMGFVKATQIKATYELARRMQSQSPEHTFIRDSSDAVKVLMSKLTALDQEHFVILCIDSRNRLISSETLSTGSDNASLVDPRQVFRIAISKSASSIILSHNHPSGNPTPSSEDVELTKELIKAGQLIGVDVLDHIIIGDGNYISMKEANLLS